MVSGVLYLLADRYLIPHVEIENVNAAVTQVADATNSSAVEKVSLVTSQESEETSAEAVADDWNYISLIAFTARIRLVRPTLVTPAWACRSAKRWSQRRVARLAVNRMERARALRLS